MSSEIDSTSRHFLEVSVAHRLLSPENAESIQTHADENDMQVADAALSLSMMKPWEVEAATLLADPNGFAPGFQLTGLIGAGSAGLVFRAHQTTLGRDVALKTINIMTRGGGSKGESRIQREAQSIARLQHPHIVAAYDSGFHKGRFWISMEFVEGETLANLIEREAPVSEAVVWSIVRQAAAALDHARQIGIIHRDIKPANLLLCEPPAGADFPAGVPFVKVADFGLAFDAMHEGDNKLTATGATLGTPAFIAPEQLQNTRVDCRADIYSLGTSVFNMLTGQVPWAGRSPMKAILDKTIGDTRWRDEFPDSVSPATTSLFLDMTATKADERVPDYASLIERIDQQSHEWHQHQQTAVSRVSRSSASGRWVQRLLGAAFVGVFALGFMFWMTEETEQPDPNPSANSSSGSAITIKDIPWEPVGLPFPLFNGTSAPFRHVVSVGTWTPEKAVDGSGVLTGSPGASLAIPLKAPMGLSSNVSLRLNVHIPSDASTAELFLEKMTTDTGIESSQILHTVTISDHSAEMFAGSDTTLPASAIQELSSATPNDVLFRRIQIRRTGASLSLMLNGEQLIKTSCEVGENYHLRIRCGRGMVSLADISITELRQSMVNTQ